MTTTLIHPAPLDRLPRARREALVGAVVVALALAVVGLWWQDTPTGSLHTAGDRLIAAGDLTALVGSYLVLVEVVLMARVPWLDRLIGMDRLAMWHRVVGQYSIGLLVAHAVLTIWGYALTSHAGAVSETRTVVLSYPDMLAATVGLGLLVAVGVASARAARRRLRYQTWYFIHLYAYVAIALSFAHQFATGADFTTHPVNRFFWAALYIAALVVILVWRVALPLHQAWARQLRVAQVVRESPSAVSVYVTGNLDDIRAESGQFFLWRFLTRDGWWQAHPYSLSAAPNPNWLRLTAKEVGDHSGALAGLHPGTRVIAEGPYGAFTARRRSLPGALLIAGGIGITPIRAMLESQPGDVVLIYRASSPDEVVFASEIDTIAAHRNATVHYIVGSRAEQPLNPTRLQQLVPDLMWRDIYVCGPFGMAEEVRASLQALGVPPSHIHSEEFAY